MNFSILKSLFLNLQGFHTKRKIIVIESDDWGTVRMSSKQAYERLLKKGHKVDNCPYNSNDSLENNDDLELLGDILLSNTDKYNRPARITIDNIVANPDFDKIEKNNFKSYFYEPFTETLKRYQNTDRVMNLYKKGIIEGIFQPQFHGREHVNVNRWLYALETNDKRFKDVFKERMFSTVASKAPFGRRGYLDSFGGNYKKEYQNYEQIIEEGAMLFEKIWGFKSTTFIAPCYTWPTSIEPILEKQGIYGIQGTHVQRVPKKSRDYEIEKKIHYLGQRNKNNQIYLTRNAFFEPTLKIANDPVEKTMEQIIYAFKFKKPAIISSHRLNYIGSINVRNRENNLKSLDTLLKKIKQTYPDVEYLSSDQLLDLIRKS
jgi:hypothetical protein